MGWAKYSEDNNEINSERVSYIYKERSTLTIRKRCFGFGYDIDDLPDKNYVLRRKRLGTHQDTEVKTGRSLSYELIYVNGRFIIGRPLNPGYTRY